MPLNKPSGNMYEWAWTYNPLGGKCLHGCFYCYVTHSIAKRLKNYGNEKYYGDTRLIEKELKTSLKKPDDGKVIFVESCGDLFGSWVSSDDIKKVLNHCKKYPENTYLFQSKNPGRFYEFEDDFPPNFILGTTIETDRMISFTPYPVPEWCIPPPYPHERFAVIQSLQSKGYHTMISIEPISDFNLEPFIKMIKLASPDFVSIGADSQKKKASFEYIFPEPDGEKIQLFINSLKYFTEVRLKNNLKRIIKQPSVFYAEKIENYVNTKEKKIFKARELQRKLGLKKGEIVVGLNVLKNHGVIKKIGDKTWKKIDKKLE